MPTVHPTAILDGDITLADDVEIGPNCVLQGDITIGPQCRLLGNVYLQGPLTMGEANLCYPFVCLGFSPQSTGYDHEAAGHGVVIGDRNRFREHVTVHRAMTDDGPTRVGDDNYFMVNSHAGHDCRVGSRNILANNVALGGHVTTGDRINIGGGTMVHQFCRVGDGAMLSGAMGLSYDLPPHFMLTGINRAGGINLVGLRRSGATKEEIEQVRWVFKMLYRRNLTMQTAIDALQERAHEPKVQMYIDFIATCERGICPGHTKTQRGPDTASPIPDGLED